jgi:hypothetical protein
MSHYYAKGLKEMKNKKPGGADIDPLFEYGMDKPSTGAVEVRVKNVR